MSINNFEKNQQAVERLLAHFDRLHEQVGRTKALTHTAQRFGIERYRVATLVLHRDMGFHDSNSERPEIAVVSGGMVENG